MTDYRKVDALNQSSLKLLQADQDPLLFKKERDPSIAPWFIFGQLVDVLLLEPDNFTDYFFTCKDYEVPSDTIRKIVDNVYANSPEGELKDKDIDTVLNNIDWYNNWKPATRKKKVIDEGTTYFNNLKSGKLIVKASEVRYAGQCVEKIKSNPYCSSLLNSFEPKVQIYFNYRDIDCKAELDFIVRINNTIIPVDVKTTSKGIYDFKYSFYKYRYDVQAAFYTLALEKQFPDAIIAPYVFIVVDKDTQDVMVFETTKNVIKGGKEGFMSKTGKIYEGYDKMIDRYIFHEEFGYDYPMEYMVNGVSTIDLI